MSISQNFGNVSPSLLLDFANTKTLDRRITFTRSTPACHYDGKTTAMAEQNLVLYSQSFNGWSQAAASVNLDVTTAPDGTTTADQAVISATTAYHDAAIQNFACVSGLQYTFSLYVKKNVGIESVYFYTTLKGDAIAKFNLNDGSYIGNAPSDGYVAFDTVSSVSVGNGWYRVIATITANSTTTTNITIGFSNNTTNTVQPVTGNGTDNFYLWGAQVEQRATATAYTATTTQPITNYIPVLLTAGGNQARFDCNPTTGESLGLLIEEARTNIVLASEQFGNATYWSNSGSINSNSVVAPNGTLTGDTIVSAESGLGASGSYQNITGLSIGTNYTLSFYVKANGANWCQIIGVTTGGSTSVTRGWFNLSTGVIGSVNNTSSSLSITSVGNGWYRCSMILPAMTGTGTTVYFTCSNGDGLDVFTNNGWNGLFVWGAQLEAGSFATSYIPTTSASVTRTADDAVITGNNLNSWFQQQQGSLYIESSYLKSGTRGPFQIGSSISNRYGFYTADQALNYFDGSVPFSTPFSSTSSKIACSLVNYDIAVSFNNNTAVAVAGGRALLNVDKLTIGSATYGGEYICGTIKKIAYYPARLTNAQLQALTS